MKVYSYTCNILIFISICIFCFPGNELVGQPLNHDFLHQKYDLLHDSPLQRKFKKIAPMPAGVVYIQRPEEGEEEIRWHFRTMKELGFTNLKGIYPVKGYTTEQIQLIAIEEGLIPWWYGEGGWEELSPELLSSLKIDPELPISEIRSQAALLDHQKSLMVRRVKKTIELKKKDPAGKAPSSSTRAFDPKVGGRGLDLSTEGEKLFVEWIKKNYANIKEVNKAYNQHHANLAVGGGGAFKNWSDFEKRWKQYNHREYRIRRDIFRFKIDHALQNIRNKVNIFHEAYPHAPYRAGGELSLFRPQAWWNVDFEGIADVMKDGGSFYPSMHFSWHFDQTDNEITKSSYIQASFMNDMFKGGWSAAWECTGGPQQFDGEKFSDPDRGFTVDDGTLTQFFLSHLAAGFKGFGIWCWSARTAGKEAGEYSLLDRHNEVTPRAKAVGRIGQVMQEYRDEMWKAHKEPLVGILLSWENEAIWAAMSDRGKDDFRERPVQARIGMSNLFIENNIPFEFVTKDDLKAGLADRYPVIMLTGMLAVNKEIMEILSDYVKDGGRLVMDMPSAWYDEYAQLYYTNEGSTFEKTFGAVIGDYQFAGKNRPYNLNGVDLHGSIGALKLTHAKTVATFTNGQAAITESSYGKGSAVVLSFEAGKSYFKWPDVQFGRTILDNILGEYKPLYSCNGAFVYRLSAPDADHYFFINDGPAKSVHLQTKIQYSKAKDLLDDKDFDPGKLIELPAYGGKWLRMEK